MMTLKGAQKHTDRLKRMQAANQKIVRALYAGGQALELEAERSITAGSVSGKGHVPSAPGSPPNQDTGFLSGNIETEVRAANPPTVTVTSKAPYSAALEYGTSKMAARPFMGVAAIKTRPKIVELVKQAVNISIK